MARRVGPGRGRSRATGRDSRNASHLARLRAHLPRNGATTVPPRPPSRWSPSSPGARPATSFDYARTALRRSWTRVSVPARRRARLPRCRRSTPTAAAPEKTSTGQGSSRRRAVTGERRRRQDRGHRRVAGEREHEQPDADADQADERRQPEERAATGRDHLPSLREPEEDRAPVPEHRSPACKRPGDVPCDERRCESRHEALRDVEKDDGNRVSRADRRQTFVAPMLPLPSVRMSTPANRATQ